MFVCLINKSQTFFFPQKVTGRIFPHFFLWSKLRNFLSCFTWRGKIIWRMSQTSVKMKILKCFDFNLWDLITLLVKLIENSVHFNFHFETIIVVIPKRWTINEKIFSLRIRKMSFWCWKDDNILRPKNLS